MNSKTLSFKDLENSIYYFRTHMITSGISKGLTHPDTIKYSQELDTLLNEYQKMKVDQSTITPL